jgi:hypothetical protein
MLRPFRKTLPVLILTAAPLAAQTTKLTPAQGTPPPPIAYEGLVPGVSTREEAVERLGKPAHEASWYSWKMLYPARNRPGHFDAIHVGDGRRIGAIEAATVPEGYESLDRVHEKLGEAEFTLELSRQTLADYSARGLRFVFDEKERTTGVAYFPAGYPRVHSGERRMLSLRALLQGPQPVPAATIAPAGEVAGADPGLLCGAAEADITPLEPDWLGPVQFTVHDRLKARAAVFTRGELTVALVGGDIFGMLKPDIDRIEERFLPAGVDHLVLAMSHVHSAGDPIGIYGFYPEKFVKRIQEGVAGAVEAALASRRKVKELRAASDELPLDGARVEGLFRNARNPGIVDPQVAVLQAIGEDGKAIVTIAHFACHPEGIQKSKDGPLEVSADFPGALCDALREKTGAQAVFLNGALGGMVTGDTRARTHEEAAGQGKRLAGEVERILAFAVPQPLRLSASRKRVEIPVTNPKMIAFELQSGRRSYLGRVVSEMFHIRLGDAEIITAPGELLPEVGFEVLARMRGYPRMIVGLANDELGYLIPAYDFRAGTYEESMSLGPAAAPVILGTAIRMLDGD